MRLVFAILICTSCAARSYADEQRVDYLRVVKPILKVRCFPCHGALKQESGLRLDTGRFIRKGGENGPGVVPKHVDKARQL